jgi:PPOX class probable F420-dependent enzyme
VAHLASSTKRGKPLVVPICFAFDGSTIFSPIDEKPKRRPPFSLRRVSNIMENPRVSMIVDEYSEDWRRLRYVLIDGIAAVLTKGKTFDAAISLLRDKYQQYSTMRIEARPMIEISPLRIVVWKARDAKVIGNSQTKRM